MIEDTKWIEALMEYVRNPDDFNRRYPTMKAWLKEKRETKARIFKEAVKDRLV